MLILYHYSFSTHSAKVRMCLSEKNLQWQSQIVDLKHRENLSDDYLKINPKGLVPTLVHDDKIITESNVILEYLDEAFPQIPLMPESPYDRARVRQHFVNESSISNDLMKVTFQWLVNSSPAPEKAIRKIKAGYKEHPQRQRRQFFAKIDDVVDENKVVRSLEDITMQLTEVNKDILEANSTYLFGEQFTLADIVWIPVMYRLEFLNLKFWEKDSAFQALHQWWGNVKRRSSFKASFSD